ncbi:MAG TPA: hypothetical protein VGR26_15015 [Acidimicrobiales bacterium]|nr:hypothetical protein [Acidimicrobiales bacterium]
MKVVQLSTSLAGRGFSHGAGSLVSMPDEQADRFVDQGVATASDSDPDAEGVTAYGAGHDTLEVIEVAHEGVPPVPPKSGTVSVVEPQPPTGPGMVGTVTGLGPEHARPVRPRPPNTATATDVAGTEPPSDRMADIRVWVGDDPDRARQALEREQAKPEDEQRPTLVGHLRTVADAGA